MHQSIVRNSNLITIYLQISIKKRKKENGNESKIKNTIIRAKGKLNEKMERVGKKK